MHARAFRRKPRPKNDGVLRTRLKALAAERRRFGYRRLHILLRREGFEVNHERRFWSYREEPLTVRKRDGRKRAIGRRAPLEVPQFRNKRWSLDFVSDALSDGPPQAVRASDEPVPDVLWCPSSGFSGQLSG
jgi:putative transposase